MTVRFAGRLGRLLAYAERFRLMTTPAQKHSWDDDYYPMQERSNKLDKTDKRVGYREGAFETPVLSGAAIPDGCHNCRFYEWGSCALVEGSINANAICKMHTSPPVYSIYASEHGEAFALHDVVSKGRKWALFNEQRFGEAPEWIHYWPAPGVFNHPSYGAIVITEERNQRMLDNFKSGVYQEKLPIDVEHDLELSGAMAWIDDMRLAKDGSLEAHVQWTEMGRELIESDRFRYFSPSVMPEWPHTVTGDRIPDVAIGGAITTRPYFKESWLRPLVASESGGLTAHDIPARAGGGTRMSEQNTPAAGVVTSVVTISREDYDRLVADAAGAAATPPVGPSDAAGGAEGVDPGTGAVASFALSDKEAQAFTEIMQAGGPQAFRAMQSEISTLRSDRQRERFTQMVAGRGGADDGAPWVGEADQNVSFLMELADKFGEDSETFKAYVQKERANAQQRKSSGLFSERGSGSRPAGGSAAETITGMVAEKMSSGAAADEAAARSLVFRERPDLYEAYRLESFSRVREAD